MDNEKKYPTFEEENGSCLSASEPLVAYNEEDTEIGDVDFNFGFKDFGYPHTLEELNAALDMADAQRSDPSKWITSVEFHTRLESKYPWLR